MRPAPTTELYDPYDDAFQADPYPVYRTLRDEHPVYRQEALNCWALSRFDDIWESVRRPQIFSSASGLTFHDDEIGTLGLAPTIVMMDPPRHTQLRLLVSKGFTRSRVAALEDAIRAFANEQIDGMLATVRDGGTVDLHHDYSTKIPPFMIGELLGVPVTDRDRFLPWVVAITALTETGNLAGVGSGALDAVADMFAFFTDLIAARRAEPCDDLISALIDAEVDDERLEDWDILGFLFAIVAGGNDTTSSLISHAVVALSTRPAQRELVANDASLWPNAVMEILRLESSVQALARCTTEDVEIHGTAIPSGSKVMMLYGSANRDEREFGKTVDELDVRREFKRHLSFSNGPHFCMGAHLAPLLARCALEELHRRVPAIGVDLSGAERQPSAFTRSWAKLPALIEL